MADFIDDSTPFASREYAFNATSSPRVIPMSTKKEAIVDLSSEEQKGAENPRGGKSIGNTREKVLESNLEHGKSTDPTVSSLIEVIDHLSRLLSEKKQDPPRYKRFLTHPLVLVLVSGLVGIGLTEYYSRRQKDIDYARSIQQKDIDYARSIQQLDLTSKRSFSDALNQIRIQKIGEVWEQIDRNETILDDLLHEANQNTGSNKKYFAKIKSLIEEDIIIVNKNRFWLGKSAYIELNQYLATSDKIVFDMLLGPPEIDLSELVRKREQAKQDVERIRDALLTGEPVHSKQPAPVDQ